MLTRASTLGDIFEETELDELGMHGDCALGHLRFHSFTRLPISNDEKERRIRLMPDIGGLQCREFTLPSPIEQRQQRQPNAGGPLCSCRAVVSSEERAYQISLAVRPTRMARAPTALLLRIL